MFCARIRRMAGAEGVAVARPAAKLKSCDGDRQRKYRKSSRQRGLSACDFHVGKMGEVKLRPAYVRKEVYAEIVGAGGKMRRAHQQRRLVRRLAAGRSSRPSRGILLSSTKGILIAVKFEKDHFG